MIHPGSISGSVQAPPSKSITQRAYAMALLHKGQTTIHYPGESDDERAALDAAMMLGLKILNRNEHNITLSSAGLAPASDTIDCGESGLAARLFTPIAAIANMPLTVTGHGSLTSRAMPMFRDALGALGVSVSNFNGYLPITVQGPLQSTDVTVDASSGSQFLSGLLLALAHSATKPLTITVHKLKSKPYIDLTLDMLARTGRPVVHTNYETFRIDPSTFKVQDTLDIDVEGDWSGAANLLVAGAINGSVTVTHLNPRSPQADRAILDVLVHAGANLQIIGNTITANCTALKGIEFDATHCPDLFPILAILAANAKGNSRIEGLHRLYNKESNRANSIAQMLQGFGVSFNIEDDVLSIEGGSQLSGAVIDPQNDHRLVMAAAVGALNAAGPVEIVNAQSVNKSYPGFFNALSLCSVNCTIYGS